MRHLFAALLIAALAAVAQQPGGSPVVSPEVSTDSRVTFRIRAPKASEVTLITDYQQNGPEKLTRGEDGTWSITVGPLAPATYIYSFTVDGMAIPDPVNGRIKLRARGAGSLFDVPAASQTLWQARDVPHGDVQINWQKSSILNGETRAYWVYTPPGYSKEAARRYPVLYLLHGSNDTAAGWTTAGSMNYILDNLIADRKAAPMIVVMPFGHATPFGARRDVPGAVSNTILFERYLLTEVMPAAEAKYRISANRENRAIGGMSMGGEQALTIGFGRMEHFSHIGAFSPSMPRELADRWAAALKDGKGTKEKMHSIWIACGRQDPGHLSASRSLDELLKTAGVKHTYVETEGAHNYALWQWHLAQWVPQIFR